MRRVPFFKWGQNNRFMFLCQVKFRWTTVPKSKTYFLAETGKPLLIWSTVVLRILAEPEGSVFC